MRGDAHHLPFPDGSFDVVIISEVLEHIPDDRGAIAEMVRVLRPGGRLAVTVPRWWPGAGLLGPVRRLPRGRGRPRPHLPAAPTARPAARGRPRSYRAPTTPTRCTRPYWWLKCAVRRRTTTRRCRCRLYHKLLVWDIMRRPWWTRIAERLLNPVVGKSLVVYLGKPRAR